MKTLMLSRFGILAVLLLPSMLLLGCTTYYECLELCILTGPAAWFCQGTCKYFCSCNDDEGCRYFCRDLDEDGFRPYAFFCDDPSPYSGTPDDCDDTNPDVNPAAMEGPEGDPTCSDGLDNDCDWLTDLDDGGCIPS